MTTGQPGISKRKVAYELASWTLAGLASWKLQPWYHASDDAAAVLVTVFSILAGFLAAVMAIVANDRILRGRNWRQDTYYLRLIRNELRRYKLTFYIYLLVLVLAFLTSLDASWPALIRRLFEHALLFFTALGIMHSFQLPEIISRKHINAMEHQIRRRRESETGEKPNGGN